MLDPLSRNTFIKEMAIKVEKQREMEEAKYALRPLLLNQPNQYGLRAIFRSKIKCFVRRFRERINIVLSRVELW